VPWGVMILPYLEQQNLYNRFQVLSQRVNPPSLAGTFNNPPFDMSSSDPIVNPAATHLKMYMCPSSPSQGQVYQDTWDNSGDAYGPYIGNPSWTVSASDYIGISGMLGGFTRTYFPGINFNHNAILTDNYQVSISQIKDGTSNTWMV